jgi:uncharacterized protein with ATP-grasp and redox domains
MSAHEQLITDLNIAIGEWDEDHPVSFLLLTRCRAALAGDTQDARHIAELEERLSESRYMLERALAADRTAELERDLAAAQDVLLYLDNGGGLGINKHKLIMEALGVPYPEFCHHPNKCMGLSICPNDPCCCD